MEAVSKLRAARDENQWTQAYVAEAVGVDERTVRHWETGDVKPRGCHIQALCQLFHKPAEELGFTASHHQGLMMVAANMDNVPMTKNLSSSIRQDLTVQLMRIVMSWPQSNDRYEELQGQIYDITDDYSRIIEHDIERVVTRRDALRTLALLPIEVCGLAQLSKALRHPTEDILIQCAAGIAACWYFRKGKELALANDALAMYIPTLRALASASSTRQKKAAASLLVQCYILKATLARHVESNDLSVGYLQQAVMYSEQAEVSLLQILAVRTLAATYFYMNLFDLALPCYLNACHLLGPSAQIPATAKRFLETAKASGIPLLVHSYVYAGMATMYAHLGKQEEALSSLVKAHITFHSQSADERSPIWVDHHEPNLLLNDGLTHYYLGTTSEVDGKQHRNRMNTAVASFTKMDTIADRSEMIRIESLLDRAMVEVNKEDGRNMEYAIDHWEQGLQGAIDLQSEQWFAESRNVYTLMRSAWPGEQRIKHLRQKIVHW